MQSSPRILVVEDSETIQAVVSAMLAKAGYHDVTLKASVEETLTWSRLAETIPDLVLIDVHLPGADGISGLRLLKDTSSFFDVPFIVMTADDSEEIVQRAFEAGALDFIRKPLRHVELLARMGSALRLTSEMRLRRNRERELLDLIEQAHVANLDLGVKSRMDYLTALANRAALDEYLARTWEDSKPGAALLGLIMIDLDYFKQFNDTYGHIAGDDALRKTASAIDSSLMRPGDLCARYGGEEFCLVLPGTGAPGLATVAERVRRRVMRLAIPHANNPRTVLTVSLGGSTEIPRSETSWRNLVQKADHALYDAKRQGRDRYCYVPA
jgi:diguanylate cyclase (GGDEF)-like protein